MNRQLQSGPGGRSAGDDVAFFTQAGGGSGTHNLIEVEFAAGPTAAADARNALGALYGRVDRHVLEDIRLLVSELVTNSVRHSNLRDADPVRMKVFATGSTLRVEVSDDGDGFEPRPRDDDRSRPGGWGLYLVDRLVDRWGVGRGGGTRVWFEIDDTPGRARPGEVAAA